MSVFVGRACREIVDRARLSLAPGSRTGSHRRAQVLTDVRP
jgi:hypothetical protein